MKKLYWNMVRTSGAVVAALLLSLVLAGPANAQPEKFHYKLDEQKLLSGGIQTFVDEYQTAGQGIKKRVVGVMILNALPDKVWQVLLDWDAMGPYVDNLEYNKTIHVFVPPSSKDKIGHSLIESQLKVLYLTINYTLDVKFDNVNYRQDWDLVDDQAVANYNKQNIPVKEAMGGLKDVEGFEYIEPYGDGSKTVYYYAPIVETAVPLPGFLQTALSKTTLNGYMEGIRKITTARFPVKTK